MKLRQTAPRDAILHRVGESGSEWGVVWIETSFQTDVFLLEWSRTL